VTRIQIVAVGGEETPPTVLEFSSFLYHLNCIYEISRLGTDPEYDDIHIERCIPSADFTQAHSNILNPGDVLRLDGVRHESPWSLKTSVSLSALAIGGLYGIVQAYDMLSSGPLNRDKLRAEIVKIQTETRGSTLSNIEKARHLHVPLTDDEESVSDTKQDERKLVLTQKEIDWLRMRLETRNGLHLYEQSERALRNLPFRPYDLDLLIHRTDKRQKWEK
jgi:hypothetical protein